MTTPFNKTMIRKTFEHSNFIKVNAIALTFQSNLIFAETTTFHKFKIQLKFGHFIFKPFPQAPRS